VTLAVALNVLAGTVALFLGRTLRPAAPAEESLPPARAAAAEIPHHLLGCFAVVGGTAIAYEVCWTRLLATTLGSSTYAFTLMLGTFLVGIVLGSFLFEIVNARWTRRGKQVSLGTFAVTQTVTALAALGFLVFFQQFPELVPVVLRKAHEFIGNHPRAAQVILARMDETFFGLVLAQFVTSGLAMLPAAVVFGFNFPVVTVLIAGRPESSGHYAAAVGRAYAANTLGAIVGATAAGFWLVPAVGAFRLVAVAASLNLLLAAYLHIRRKVSLGPEAGDGGIVKAVLNVALVAVVSFVAFSGAFYDRALATFGTVLYYDRYDEKLTVPEIAATTDVLFAADGLNATISVARTEDYLALRTNGKVDASNRDRITQLLLGHLGAIFHPAPRRVLVVGFGSGMTISALALHPEIESITCVEIEPAVMRAADYLQPLNRNVLRDPRVHTVLDDARDFLLTTREKFDLIVSEPSNPWIAGVAALYTDEFYREARARLRPDGLFVQWVQAYSLYPEDFEMVLGTFAPHFPQVTLWRGEPPDYILIGQVEATPLSLDHLRAEWDTNAALRADFDSLGLRRPEGIVGFHRLDDADLRKLAAGASARNTDDRNRLEYHAPRGLLVKGLEDKNHEAIWKQRSGPLSKIARVDDALVGLLAATETLINLNDDDADYFIGYLQDAPESAELALLRGRWNANNNRLADAKKEFDLALRLDQRSLDAAFGLAEVARRNGQYDTAELLYRQIVARDPKYLRALGGMMRVCRAREQWDLAAQWQASFLKLNPNAAADEFARLGEVLMEGGKTDLAVRAFEEALRREPYSYAAHRNLGQVFLQQKQWDAAEQHLTIVERFHPDGDAGSYVALAELYRATGRPRSAADALRKGLRMFPDSEEIKRLATATK
jgi:spermidine synthase